MLFNLQIRKFIAISVSVHIYSKYKETKNILNTIIFKKSNQTYSDM